MAREGIDVDEFIIQYVNTWFLVTPPTTGTGEEEEEIAAVENEDRSAGRMGSVCEMHKKKNTRDTAATAPPPSITDDHDPITTTQSSQESCLKSQRKTLEDLLDVVNVPIPTDPETYAACRERLAMLRAFERKLCRLLTDSQKKCERAKATALELSGRKPEYLTQYMDRYRQTLAESGLKPENTGLMSFLLQDLSVDGGGGEV